MNELNSGNSKRNKGNVEMLRLGLGFLELVFSSFFFFFCFCFAIFNNQYQYATDIKLPILVMFLILI